MPATLPPALRRPEAHARPVSVWQLADRHAAEVRLATHPDLPAPERVESDVSDLQRSSGAAPFFLAGRTAGRPLEADYNSANRWLHLLQHDKVLVRVEPGTKKKSGALPLHRYTVHGPD